MRPRLPLRGYRAAQFTIATTMLAAPASAVALGAGTSAAAEHPASLLIQVTPRDVAYGRPVRVSGRVPADLAGATVHLETAATASAPWRRVAVTRVGRHGGFEIRTRLRESALLRAVAVAPGSRASHVTPATDTATGPASRVTAVSRRTRVQVAAEVRVADRPREAIAGRDTTISGRLLPARAGRAVAVQDHTRRGWEVIGRGRTGAAGGFSAHVNPPAGTARHLRVMFAGDHLNGRATAGAGSLSLFSLVVVSWYDDAGSTACGFHAGDGVASRTLPCGTRVAFRSGGRSVVATVDDRGPYVGGREFDLNQTTAGALGFSGVGVVEADIR